jgi:hypothetical protein
LTFRANERLPCGMIALAGSRAHFRVRRGKLARTVDLVKPAAASCYARQRTQQACSRNCYSDNGYKVCSADDDLVKDSHYVTAA